MSGRKVIPLRQPGGRPAGTGSSSENKADDLAGTWRSDVRHILGVFGKVPVETKQAVMEEFDRLDSPLNPARRRKKHGK